MDNRNFVADWTRAINFALQSSFARPRPSGETSSAGPLEIGLNHAVHIREERLTTRRDACRLLYVSDIHLRNGRSDMLCRHVFDSVTRCNPHAVLLGGDLVDRRSELGKLSELVDSLHDVAPVLAVGGNHDQQVGIERVRDAVMRGGGQWIHDGSARVTHGDRVIAVSGPQSAPPADGHVRVLCAHNPRIWKTSRHAGYDLVLAGHLHGFQLVACEYRDRLFPGAIFYPYCFLSHQRGSTRLVVSRGVSDLLPLRWRCPREVVLCYV
jgi:predicted MPP superfamily phosphohydrolase